MDTSVLKTLLASQDQAYRSALEVFMKQINDKVEGLQATVAALTASLEFTQREFDDSKREVKQLQEKNTSKLEEMKRLTDELHVSKTLIADLEDKCNYQEDYSRRNNLQIIGIEENPNGETWEQTASQVSKLLEGKLGLPDIQLERAHRVGQRLDQHHRPIIARFSRFCDRDAAMRNATKLRGTRIFINDDLCRASQEKRRAQLPLLKQARSDGKIAYFRHTKLIIKERAVAAWSVGRAASGVAGGASDGGAVAAGAGAGGMDASGAWSVGGAVGDAAGGLGAGGVAAVGAGAGGVGASGAGAAVVAPLPGSSDTAGRGASMSRGLGGSPPAARRQVVTRSGAPRGRKY